ncbi:hypothetical protein NQ315_000795 [Exocentrus adspersus]|uniref:TIL domain-containing protein n=1 Tax=Exocentrus adspersus TaxID=1586481 RepID=A0AAV8WDP1_9CUCU|nr:hypothetical protein NQ315_000795 [Exocentrus adspersus]
MKATFAGTLFCCVFLLTSTFTGGQAAEDEQCSDPKAVYRSCGTACRATCQNRQTANCAAVCVPGCFCKPNYIYDEESKKCVTIRNCPRH